MTHLIADAPAYQISSVGRALTLLTEISDRPQILVSEAAALLGTSPSTAHRILQMLVHHGYVEQGEHRAYRRGPAMSRLSDGRAAPASPAAIARPHVLAARAQLRGTVHLVALEGNGARFLAGAEQAFASPEAKLRLGWLLPAHVVAGGKALLAELSQESLTLLYPGGVPLTRSGRIQSLGQLRRELTEVRRAGYARSVNEAVDGVTALGVAVPVVAGGPRLALSIGWPVGTPRHDEAATIACLRTHADELAASLEGDGAETARRAS